MPVRLPFLDAPRTRARRTLDCVGLLVLAAALAGCGRSPDRSANQPPPPVERLATGSPPVPSGITEVDDTAWRRMRECSESADRLRQRDFRDGVDHVLGSDNHYSPKWGRCFLRVGYGNPEARRQDRRAPAMFYELYDVFEHRQLATCTDALTGGSSDYCDVSDDITEAGNCRACRTFVKARMTE